MKFALTCQEPFSKNTKFASASSGYSKSVLLPHIFSVIIPVEFGVTSGLSELDIDRKAAPEMPIIMIVTTITTLEFSEPICVSSKPSTVYALLLINFLFSACATFLSKRLFTKGYNFRGLVLVKA